MRHTMAALLALACPIAFHGPPSGALFAANVIELEVNETASDADDYIGWAPVPARIRVTGASADVPVKLNSTKRPTGGNSGEVQFAPYSPTRPTPATFHPQDSLDVTLPSSGAWKSFWAAGKESSADGKDVKILVNDSAGALLHERPLMVRVRKDAETLTTTEITRFLTALATLHDVAHNGQGSKYLRYVHVHEAAFVGHIHWVPAFTPWHRTMLLSLERELQAIDPRVALPYWKFDQNAPHLFTPDFIGTVTGGSSIVSFSSGNPINGWKMPDGVLIQAMTTSGPIPISDQPLQRVRNGNTTHPSVSLQSVNNTSDFGLMWDFLEGSYHDSAHTHIGGWLASAQSPKDPLFYLLHANVDRAWAQWQKDKNAFDGESDTGFKPQGGYPGTGATDHQGSYANDTQWPWNLHGGDQGTSDPGDDWPAFTFGLTPSPSNHGPSTIPVVKDVIDYEDALGNGFPIGYSYDTIKWH